MKNFKEEFIKFLNKIRKKENFSFQRFADGELWILEGREYSLSPTSHGYVNPEDWKYFNPNLHTKQREHLFSALKYKQENYHIGIIVGNSEYNTKITNKLFKISEQHEENITYANLFVNANYMDYKKYFIEEYKNWEVILVCNEKSNIKLLPFPIKKVFYVGSNCIVNNYNLVEEISEYTNKNKIKNHLFLFCCSSLGNYCIRNLSEIEPENTYIDCGSTLNPFLGLSLDRGYLSIAENTLYRGQKLNSNDLEIIDEDWDVNKI
jgi:hypothetical protein